MHYKSTSTSYKSEGSMRTLKPTVKVTLKSFFSPELKKRFFQVKYQAGSKSGDSRSLTTAMDRARVEEGF